MEEAGARKSTPRTRIWPQGGEGKGEGKASDAEQALTGSADSTDLYTKINQEVWGLNMQPFYETPYPRVDK